MRAWPVLVLVAASLPLPAAARADAPVNVQPPAIAANPRGTAYVNQTLAEVPGVWRPAPGHGATIVLQWDACDKTGEDCSPIPGATGQSYAIQPSDVGRTIRVTEVASDGSAAAATARSAATVVVIDVPGYTVWPLNAAPPTIAGAGRLGGTLVASPGGWSGTAPLAYSYQWLRCWAACVRIRGATGPSHTITRADARTTPYGRKTVLSVVVTAKNSGGTATAYANPGTAVDAPRMKPPNVVAALDAVCRLLGPASTIPQLLRNGGYKTMYYSRRAGRVDLYWALREEGKRLAQWHANLGQAGWVRVKIRLTPYGRRVLTRAHALTIYTYAHLTFRPGPHGEVRGGTGVGENAALSETEPAEQV